MRTIAADLTRRGVPTAEGRRIWSSSNMAKQVAAARYCGWREWDVTAPVQKTTRRGFRPMVAAGDWPAILDRGTTEALRAVLSDPGRTRSAPTRLLTGILRCGRCGGRMSSQFNRGRHGYACNGRHWSPLRCRGVSMSEPRADEAVTGWVLAALADAAALRMSPDRPTAATDLTKARDRLDALTLARGAGQITDHEWRTERGILLTHLERMQNSAREQGRLRLHDSLSGGGTPLPANWPTMTLAQRRTLIRSVLDRVTVPPAIRGQHVRDRLIPVWHT